MSIAIIRYAHSASRDLSAVAGEADDDIPCQVIEQLMAHAAMAGKSLVLCNCVSEIELMKCLDHIDERSCEFVLLDPGGRTSNDDRLRDVVQSLQIPFIEVHDDFRDALEPTLAPDCSPRLHLVQGYGAQSYNLALSIALEHLGCAECENDIHVGT